MPIKFHSLLISDVHLGSPMCQARELHEFLSNLRVRTLIINGDIFEDLKFYRLDHWHWEAFGQIRKISDHCKVVWIRGNHDLVDAKLMSHLLGVRVQGQYKWSVGERRLFATHGDRWDAYIYRHRRLTELITGTYNLVREFSSDGMRSFTRFLKKKSKLMLRNHEAILKNAVSYGASQGLDGVFCGHTHMASLEESRGVLYGNSGTWESDHPHFLGVNPDGVALCRYLHSDQFDRIRFLSFPPRLETQPALVRLPEPRFVPRIAPELP